MVGGPLAIASDDDLERAADRPRPTLALYIGGMGARGVCFHHEAISSGGSRPCVLTTFSVSCDIRHLARVAELVRR